MSKSDSAGVRSMSSPVILLMSSQWRSLSPGVQMSVIRGTISWRNVFSSPAIVVATLAGCLILSFSKTFLSLRMPRRRLSAVVSAASASMVLSGWFIHWSIAVEYSLTSVHSWSSGSSCSCINLSRSS